MRRRDNSVLQAIKGRLNLVDIARRYVELRRAGPRWVAPCPFHQETKPSFSIHEEQGFFYCFGCQASGDLFDFYGRINGLDFRDTVEALAEEVGIALDTFKADPKVQQEQSLRRQCLRMYEVASNHFRRNLTLPAGEECRAYIARRELAPAIVEAFELGWSLNEWQALADTLRRAGFSQQMTLQSGLLAASDSGRPYDRFRGRLIFPIKNLTGQVIAFGGRIIGQEDQAKYINSSDSPIYKKGDNLYGLFQARRSISQHKSAMLTEGYMDVLTLHQYGYTNAVGVLGTALTPEQVKRLAGFCSDIELLFDGDNPGRKAALRSCEMLLTRGMRCRVVLMPEGEDIDSLLHANGKEGFEALRKASPDGLDFCIRTVGGMAPREMLDWVRQFLKQVEQPELLSYYMTRLSGGLGLNEAELRDAVAAQVAPRHNEGAARTSSPRLSAEQTRDREIMTFAVRYPHCLSRLREAGADMALSAAWARQLWEKLEQFPSDEVVYQLSEREKGFWIRCRTGEVPPLDNEEGELAAVCQMLEGFQVRAQKASVSAALRRGAGAGDFEADKEYLRALQETLGRSNGEH